MHLGRTPKFVKDWLEEFCSGVSAERRHYLLRTARGSAERRYGILATGEMRGQFSKVIRFLLIGSMGVLLLTSCQRPAQPLAEAAEPAAENTNQRLFQVNGIVKAIHPERKEIEIKHEAIPGYMPAMTMPFDVKDTNELAGLAPEQPISFRLTVTDTDGWVDKIQSRGPVPVRASTNTDTAKIIRVVEPLQTGQPLPEYALTNQFGARVTTSQFKGQAVALTFLFTRCPFPTFCPRLANDFEQTQQKMLSLANGPTNWQLLTISFDPDFDRPEVLKGYAEAHGYDPKHWTFATGELGDISALGDLFGLAFWHDSTGSITHNMRTAVIDANGNLQRVFEGKDWTSAELAAELVKASKP